MGIKRRTVLATIGIGGTAGCAKMAAKGAVKASDDVAERAETDVPSDWGFDEPSEMTRHPPTSFETVDRLGRNEHLPLELDYSRYSGSDVIDVLFEYSITVQTGDSVDAMLFPRDEFLRFERGLNAEYDVSASRPRITDTATKEVVLSPRDYVLVVENSTPEFVESLGSVLVGVETTGWIRR